MLRQTLMLVLKRLLADCRECPMLALTAPFIQTIQGAVANAFTVACKLAEVAGSIQYTSTGDCCFERLLKKYYHACADIPPTQNANVNV
jgi:hypothetical protein